ncbi:MAG TPA: Mth938-like domain-containing protein [Xanthomonadales bacterium]|nr:Mth938-like domain-containing protein [Xanthomonadales bacterium]
MQLTRENPGDRTYVRAVDEKGIRIGEDTHTTPLILSPGSIDTGWTVTSFEKLSKETLQPLLALEPEVVIVGTGRNQQFPDPSLLMPFHKAGIGIEIMNTPAACRTFNILVMEERKVVAGLIPLTA